MLIIINKDNNDNNNKVRLARIHKRLNNISINSIGIDNNVNNNNNNIWLDIQQTRYSYQTDQKIDIYKQNYLVRNKTCM